MIPFDAIAVRGPAGLVPANSAWPPPAGARTHSRSTGTFARTLRVFVRELGLLPLTEAIRRRSLLPTQVLENTASVARRKGRVQPGADADLVVFDPPPSPTTPPTPTRHAPRPGSGTCWSTAPSSSRTVRSTRPRCPAGRCWEMTAERSARPPRTRRSSA
ncbi:hypothetical protein [Thermocatellispora tengchongensis]|uniref:hypothetical protein n=1 Tax=Thermocatellispora tengchongensis TaxID=1073253 RepID=UPI0036455AFB